MKRREQIVAIVILTVIAAVLRFGFVATTEVRDPIRADAAQYVQYAKNLATHGTFSMQASAVPAPDSFRSPGYPVFLAGVIAAAGEGRLYDVARWIQALLGACLVPLCWILAQRWLPIGVSFAAAGLTALSPHLVASTGYLLSEALSAPLLLLGLAILAHARSVRAFACAGMVLGALALTNEALALLPLALGVALLVRDGVRCSRRACLALVLPSLLALGAWQARCACVVADGAPKGGERMLATLSHGTYPGLVFSDPKNRGFAYRDDPEQPAISRSWSRFAAVVGARVAERPLRHLAWYAFEKPCWVWSWDIVQGQGDVFVYPVSRSLYDRQPVADLTRLLMKALHPLVVALALLALVLRKTPCVLAVPLVYATLVFAAFLPDPRYMAPLKPLCYVAACGGALLAARSVIAWRRRSGRVTEPSINATA